MGALKPFLAAVLILLAPAAFAQPLACPAPEKAMLRAELYFGRSTGGAHGVSEHQWADFLAKELTARFPDGLTVLDAHGQWRDKDGHMVSEKSKVVTVIAPNAEPTYEHIGAAAAAYKLRFRQKSVLIVTRPVCAEF
jgi:hypothetical protein